MLFLFVVFFILFAIFAMLYLESFWSNAITLINVTLASLLALNFFEPVATLLDSNLPSFTYLWDYISLWLMFCICFGVLRGLTDAMSRTRVKFRPPIEIPGRMICALGVGLVMVGFIVIGFHVAPLPPAPFGGGIGVAPNTRTLLLISPDRQLLGFMQSTSRGSLSRGAVDGQPVHPDDRELNVNAFDPQGEFVLKYRQRRRDLSQEEGLRVLKE